MPRNTHQEEPQWYALLTNLTHEQAVAKRLAGLKFTVEVPMCLDEAGKKHVPALPGYVLIRTVPTYEQVDRISGISGVRGWMRVNGAISPIKTSELTQFTARMIDESQLRVRRFKVDDRVCITDGPFEGFTGKVKRSDRNDRLTIEVEIFGRQTEVELNKNQVELVKEVAISSSDG